MHQVSGLIYFSNLGKKQDLTPTSTQTWAKSKTSHPPRDTHLALASNSDAVKVSPWLNLYLRTPLPSPTLNNHRLKAGGLKARRTKPPTERECVLKAVV